MSVVCFGQLSGVNTMYPQCIEGHSLSDHSAWWDLSCETNVPSDVKQRTSIDTFKNTKRLERYLLN